MISNIFKRIEKFFLYKNNLLIFVSFLIFIFFINSLLLSKNIFDPHHVNLVFAEASDFFNGKRLYKEIFIKYGVLSTLINAFGLNLFGDNIFSIFLLTNIFYFFSIFLLFIIFIQLKINKLHILFLVLIIINVHSSPTLPWSNFLAFLPIILSIFFLLPNQKQFFFSGFFLSLSSLVRETYFISAVIIFLFVLYYLYINKNKKNLIFYTAGFFLPLILFFIYLILSENFLIWKELNFKSYRADLELQVGFGSKYFNSVDNYYVKFFFKTINKILSTISDAFAMWYFLMYLIFISCFCLLFLDFFKYKNITFKSVIALYSLALSLQFFHIFESWRFVCGSVVGIIIFNEYFNNFVKKKYVNTLYTIFLISFLIFNWKFYYYSTKNYIDFFQNNPQENFKKLNQFKNMNYSKENHSFYLELIEYCQILKNSHNIKYSINYTGDSSLHYFCETISRYYYPWKSNSLIDTSVKSFSSKYYPDATEKNTIIFLNFKNLSEIDNYRLLYLIKPNNQLIEHNFAIVQSKL